jgi:hypothetical protein
MLRNTSVDCPADGFETDGTSSGDSIASICDDLNMCDGTGVCQENAKSSETKCRAAPLLKCATLLNTALETVKTALRAVWNQQVHLAVIPLPPSVLILTRVTVVEIAKITCRLNPAQGTRKIVQQVHLPALP